MKLFWKAKPKSIKVAVIGNCQARPIAKIMQSLSSQIEVTTTGIVHLLKNEERSIYEQGLRIADFIFAQRVADDYPCTFVRSDNLKNKWGDKVSVWPNLYYRGYNPELRYLRIFKRQQLRGPLGDYHIQTFLEGWKNHLSVKDTLNLHNSMDYNREKYGRVPEDSLAELREREKDCDIKISSYIEERFRRKRLFFTFNHPTLDLLLLTTRALIDNAGIYTERIEYFDRFEPLGQLQLPPNPWVVKNYGMDLDDVNVWKGLKVKEIKGNVVITGKSHQFHDEEIVDIFFQIYSANKDIIYRFLNSQNS